MTDKISVGIVGVTGYTGMELLRLLASHPVFLLQAVTSRQEKDKRLGQIFPQFLGHDLADIVISEPDPEELADTCSLVFLALPHGTAMEMAAPLLQLGIKVVDFSADFRLKNADQYEQWYQVSHKYPDLLSKSVYGLTELNAERISQAKILANPGCYPTSAILGLYPALARELVSPQGLIIDSKSGVSGAGRKAKTDYLFCEIYDSFKPYSLGKHRHTPEIEQELGRISGQPITLSFSPHLLPLDRGIISTIYAEVQGNPSEDSIRNVYREYYSACPWIRILDSGVLPQTKWVRGTMYCDIGLVLDRRCNRLIIVSAIDNLCRGASGQALANANLMSGLNVKTGLNMAAMTP